LGVAAVAVSIACAAALACCIAVRSTDPRVPSSSFLLQQCAHRSLRLRRWLRGARVGCHSGQRRHREPVADHGGKRRQSAPLIADSPAVKIASKTFHAAGPGRFSAANHRILQRVWFVHVTTFPWNGARCTRWWWPSSTTGIDVPAAQRRP